MSANDALTGELRRQVSLLEGDLRNRVEDQPEVLGAWKAEHDAARKRERTAATWSTWRDQRVTQAAVAWVLTTVFVRFCEDNALVRPVWIAGPANRRQEALDAQRQYFRTNPMDTDREWIDQAIRYLAALPATKDLVDERSALHLASPSGDAAAALLAFWRERDEQGQLLRDLTDPTLSTRFLGDLYQDISESARLMYALLQTPVFVEEFILDRTLEPALAERPLDGFRMIDPTCGSGHFLLGAFARLLDRWNRQASGLETQARVQEALNAVHGVDINPFAVAIARFRLTLAALQACGLTRLEAAPSFRYHLATGDSLWFGADQQTFDYDAGDSGEAGLFGFAYSYEDRAVLRDILRPSQYDSVVGNPPYITVKDKALNSAYRSFYGSCKGTYAMTVPFMELFFGLATQGSDVRPAGWVGQITANSFMKREFGAPLIEQFLKRKDLRLVIDASGAYIPGHGTPTLVLIGRNESPVTTTVRAVLGIRGEPGRPVHPENGIVWRSITDHFGDPGHDDGWTSTAELDRSTLANHPWSLAGGGALEVQRKVQTAGESLLGAIAFRIGFMAMSHADEAFTYPSSMCRRLALPPRDFPLLISGEQVRDYTTSSDSKTWFPYENGELRSLSDESELELLWPLRTVLGNRSTFEGGTYLSSGRRWFEWHQVPRDSGGSALSIAFAEVVTHNQFILDRGGQVFKQSAPVIKLSSDTSEEEHLGLLGILNSSTVCFWLRQTCSAKGGSGIGRGIQPEAWMERYNFNSTNVAEIPIPARRPIDRGRLLNSLGCELRSQSDALDEKTSTPSGETLVSAECRASHIRARMLYEQEELDWEVYRLYDLTPEALTYTGDDMHELDLGQRAFEIALARKVEAGEHETAWFHRHGSTPITNMPSDWPGAYSDLVQRRLDLIESSQSIRLLEKPEYKRRWSYRSSEKRRDLALRDWLLDRLDHERFWFDSQGRPTPTSLAQLADNVSYEEEMCSVLAVWEGRPDLSMASTLAKLLDDESVPFLAAYRYKESGLRKRRDWEETWASQRREDAGEKFEPIPVPPNYTSVDFARASYWQARGKLDIPKERFILYQNAGRDTDPTPVLGWAGWDHAQRALALNALIQQREQEGWDDERLVPLIAGLAELQPWIDQWHSDVDPTYGVSLAAFCREQLATRSQRAGKTPAELAAWRPAPTTTRRGRKPRAAGASS